jgi:decaprenyl-phosphate phosphoribosyltransferase
LTRRAAVGDYFRMVERVRTLPGIAIPPTGPTPSGTLARVGAWPTLRGLVVATRPRQWTKNLLVLAAPAAAGIATQPAVLARMSLALTAFCAAAAATYLVNDLADRDEDRLHPAKRTRPLAAGLVSPLLAATSAVALALAGLTVALATSPRFAVALASYLAVTTSYSLGLRRVAVVELGMVASGFVIRVIAGGLATGVPVSQWLLIVVSFGALFVVAGKRHGDLAVLGGDPGRARAALSAYTAGYLRFVVTLAAAVMLIAYCLWAFTVGVRHGVLAELSVLPLTLGVLRYGLLLESGAGGAPEEILLRDHALLVLSLMWAAVYGLGIYLGT